VTAGATLLREIAEDALDALYPRTCALCGGTAADGLACELHRLPREPCGARCATCDASLPKALASLPKALASLERCASCRRESPGFARLVALADYRAQPRIAEWVLAFKYGGRAELGEPLGRALAQRWIEATSARRAASELFVPVPLHAVRLLERGYDQARLLAEAAARAANVACVRALVRSRATTVQGSPGAVSRAANVRGAFRPARWPLRLATRVAAAERVWLVDDVVTSGATVRECARAVRRMGAREVGVLALARAGEARESS
jgi:ComF family protein